MAEGAAAHRSLPLLFEEWPEPEGSPYLELPDPAEASGQARYLLYYDELTGLFNRRLFTRRLADETERARENGTPLSVVWLNVDRFRAVNDEYGHLQGDHVLARVGAIVRDVVAEAGVPARFAGDEFAIVCPATDSAAAARLAGALLDRLRTQPIRLLNSPLTVQLTLSAGLATFPQDVSDAEKLPECAQRAARRASREGRDRLALHGAEGSERLEIEGRFPCPVLVGRDLLVQDMESLLRRELAGGPPVLLMKGAQGLGKTRLADVLTKRLEARGVRVLGAPSRAETVGQPFATLIRGVEDLLKREPRVLGPLLAVLHESERTELMRLVPALAAVPEGEPLAPAPEGPGAALRVAFVRMLGVLCEERPLTVLLDDAHWAERTSLQVLKLLWGRRLPGLSVVLVAATDDPEADVDSEGHPLREFLGDVQAAGCLELMTVMPLGPAHVKEMVEAILPCPTQDGVAAEVYRRSTGSPLVVEELLKYLLQSDRLTLQNGRLGLKDAEGLPSDGTLMQARMRAMDGELRTLLSHAAALGGSFDLSTLVDVEGQDEGRLRGLLEAATRADVLRAEGDGESFRFASDPLRRGLYEAMAEEERQGVHREIARTRMAEGAARPESMLSELAYHLRKAGDAGQARRMEKHLSDLHRRTAPATELGELQEVDDPRELKIQRDLSPEEMHAAVEVARRIRILTKAVRIYGFDHPQVGETQRELQALLDEFHRTIPRLDLSEARGVLIVNGEAPDPASQRQGRMDMGANWNLQSLSFLQGINRAEIEALTDALSLPLEDITRLGGMSALLQERGVVHVVPNERLYVEVGERDVLMRRTSDDGLVLIKDTGELEQHLGAMTGFGGGLDWGLVAGEGGAAPGGGPVGNWRPGEATAEVSLDELSRLMAAREEVAAWYEEMSKYIDLSFVEALSADWGVLVADLESGNRIKIAAAARTFLERGEESIYTLTQLLARSGDVRARKLAIYLLRRVGHDVLPHLLTAVHETQSDEERPRLLACLEDFDAPAVVDTLAAFVSHPAPGVRHEVIRILESRSPMVLETEVTRILHQRKVPVDVGVDCIAAAGRNRFVELAPRLMALCRPVTVLFFDHDPRLQAQACQALGQLREKRAVPILLSCVARHGWVYRTKSPEIRAAAALALANFELVGSETAVLESVLDRASRDKEPTVRAAAKVALARRKARRGEVSPDLVEVNVPTAMPALPDDEPPAAPPPSQEERHEQDLEFAHALSSEIVAPVLPVKAISLKPALDKPVEIPPEVARDPLSWGSVLPAAVQEESRTYEGYLSGQAKPRSAPAAEARAPEDGEPLNWPGPTDHEEGQTWMPMTWPALPPAPREPK